MGTKNEIGMPVVEWDEQFKLPQRSLSFRSAQGFMELAYLDSIQTSKKTQGLVMVYQGNSSQTRNSTSSLIFTSQPITRKDSSGYINIKFC